MNDISELFSSLSRVRVLETLWHLPCPLPLRHVANLSEQRVFAVERVMKELLKEKLVRRKKSGNKTLYSLNRENAVVPFLIPIFESFSAARVAARAPQYQERLDEVIQFSDEVLTLFNKEKRGTRRHT